MQPWQKDPLGIDKSKTTDGSKSAVERLVKPLTPCNAQYYAILREADGNEESITLEQNLEAPWGDHYRVDVSLMRWRTKDKLAAYLRQIAAVIEAA
jgi:hypothetical protein